MDDKFGGDILAWLRHEIREMVREALSQAWDNAGLINDNNIGFGDDYIEYTMTIWINTIRLNAKRRPIAWYDDVSEPWKQQIHERNLYFDDSGCPTEELIDFFVEILNKE